MKQHPDVFLGDCYFRNSIMWGAERCLLAKKPDEGFRQRLPSSLS